MQLEQLIETLPEYAKDIRLNINSLFSNVEATGLAPAQFYGSALAIAYSLRNKALIAALEFECQKADFPNLDFAAKTAATLMAMTNVYYRAIHLAEDKELTAMPANLRMNGLIKHGIDKTDFELFALAVSAINGCGMCISTHVKQLKAHSVTNIAIQSVLRLAATLNAFVAASFCAEDNLSRGTSE